MNDWIEVLIVSALAILTGSGIAFLIIKCIEMLFR